MNILKIFKEESLNIIDEVKLIEYIDFCNKHDKKKHTKFETELHHILPKSIFKDYTNLSKNTWNGSYLTYQDHYNAHELLCLAIKDYRIFKSLEATRNKNRFGEIEDSMLYASLKKQASIMHSKYMNEMIEYEGKKIKRSEYNMRNFSNYITSEVEINGVKTTRAKEIGKKSMNTLKENLTEYNGVIMTRLEARQIKRAESARKNGKWYKLFNENDELVGEFPAVEIRNFYKALESTSKDKPLGHNKRYRFRITKPEYIGFYVELIK